MSEDAHQYSYDLRKVFRSAKAEYEDRTAEQKALYLKLGGKETSQGVFIESLTPEIAAQIAAFNNVEVEIWSKTFTLDLLRSVRIIPPSVLDLEALRWLIVDEEEMERVMGATGD